MKTVMKRILASVLTFILVFSMQPDIELIKNDDGGAAVQFNAGPEEVLAADNTDPEVTGLDEWEWEYDRYDESSVDLDAIALTKYKGDKRKIKIPGKFTKDGKTYKTKIASLGNSFQTSRLQSIVIDKGVRAEWRSNNMFEGCRKGDRSFSYLEYLDASGLDTSDMDSMEGMFKDLSNLKYLNVSGFDTSRIQSMKEMFADDPMLQELDLTSFNSTSVRDFEHCFRGDTNLRAMMEEMKYSRAVKISVEE